MAGLILLCQCTTIVLVEKTAYGSRAQSGLMTFPSAWIHGLLGAMNRLTCSPSLAISSSSYLWARKYCYEIFGCPFTIWFGFKNRELKRILYTCAIKRGLPFPPQAVQITPLSLMSTWHSMNEVEDVKTLGARGLPILQNLLSVVNLNNASVTLLT